MCADVDTHRTLRSPGGGHAPRARCPGRRLADDGETCPHYLFFTAADMHGSPGTLRHDQSRRCCSPSTRSPSGKVCWTVRCWPSRPITPLHARRKSAASPTSGRERSARRGWRRWCPGVMTEALDGRFPLETAISLIKHAAGAAIRPFPGAWLVAGRRHRRCGDLRSGAGGRRRQQPLVHQGTGHRPALQQAPPAWGRTHHARQRCRGLSRGKIVAEPGSGRFVRPD